MTRSRRAWRALSILAAALLATGAAGYGFVSGCRPFVAPGPDPSALPYRGAGGDPAVLDALSGGGHAAQLYRGRLLNNLTRRGVAGFLVCAHAAPSSRGLLRGSDGRELACALTDGGGRFTFAGLPRNVETTLSLRRPGFLQLAFTMRTNHPAEYQQDDVATVPAALARRAYADDPRFPFAAAEGGPDRGEMAFTVVHERRAADDPLRGYVSPGMYEANGVEGARVLVFTDAEGTGRFATPYPTDGLVYADTAASALSRRLGGAADGVARVASWIGLRRLVTLLELPAPWRADSSRLGLAILKSMPPGIYEAEAVHPSLDCLPARDAWPATAPRRARFEVLRSTLGDVRFTCAERR